MTRRLTLLAAVSLAATAALADERSAETERVVMRHLAASEAGDASVVPRDYAEDAVVIFGNEAAKGVDAIQRVFENLYARTELRSEERRVGKECRSWRW